MPNCCAPNCNNSTVTGYKLYVFPNYKTDLQRRQVWLSNAKIVDFPPQIRAGLCKEHFDNDQFEKRIPGKLKWNAIPTVFDHSVLKVAVPQRKSTRPRKKVKFHDASDSEETPAKPQETVSSSDITVTDVELSDLVELCESGVQPEQEEQQGTSSDQENLKQKSPADVDSSDETWKPSSHRLRKRVRFEKNDDFLYDSDELHTSNDVSAVTWSEAAINKALNLRFSCGYHGYNALREQGLPLPSDDTLRRKLENIPFKNGLLTNVFQLLKSRVKSLLDHEKKVSLVIDEIAIQPSLEYDLRSESVVGSLTVPESKTNQNAKTCNEEEEDEEGSRTQDEEESSDGQDILATHGIIFTLQGLTTFWKQTVAYELIGNSFKARSLQILITNIIGHCHDIGLEVRNIIMDVGDGNEGILKEFGISFENILDISNTIPHPYLPKSKLYFFSSFPNLLKCLRNHLMLDGDIFLPGPIIVKYNLPCSIVSFSHVQNMMVANLAHDLNLASHIKYSYLSFAHFEKLKEVPAQNLFSRETASALRVMVARNHLPEDALSTAWFFEQISNWYELVTAKTQPVALAQFSVEKLNAAVKSLNDFILLVLSMNIGSEDAARKSVQKEIFISTTSITMVKNSLFHNGDCMDGFNQNSLETLFSIVKFRNSVPTVLEFKNAFRLIALSQLLKGSSHGSYTVAPRVNMPISALRHVDVTEAIKLAFSNKDSTEMRLSELREHTLYNLCVYCVTRYIRLNDNCDVCVNFIVSRGKPCNILEGRVEVPGNHLYSPDLHTYASLEVFKFLQIAEQTVLSSEEAIIKCEVVIPQLREQIMVKSDKMVFPACHLVKEKLLDWYLSVRIYSFLTEKII